MNTREAASTPACVVTCCVKDLVLFCVAVDKALQTQVLIIGGGATGTSLARDLTLRGVKCVLVEKDDLNAGASGRNHGLLHSGCRYVENDKEAAAECREEGDILKRTAPRCIQETGGYFVAVAGDDEGYVADFPGHCEACGIPVREVDPLEAREHEPALSLETIAVFEVPDASIDPFMLSLASMAQAQRLDARLLRRSEVVGFDVEGGRIRAARVRDAGTGEELTVEAEQVVNAGGAWARQIAEMAGASIGMKYSKGTLVITHGRLAIRAINRLRPPGNADIMMPGGTVSIVGTTSEDVDDLDVILPTVEEVDLIVDEASAMLPGLLSTRYIRAFAGVRPLVLEGGGDGDGGEADGRAVSRGFSLVDHTPDGVENLVTIAGGKLTTCRLMAEKAADLVCERLGVDSPCLTRTDPLPLTEECEWTEPGLSPRRWIDELDNDDALICECEMVSRHAIDTIVASLSHGDSTPSLADLGLRSRVGKGACQGSFCSVRALAHLYNRHGLKEDRGLADIADFFRGRWRGLHSILWGEQLAQAELMEAVHCALFNEELLDGEEP